MWRRKVGMRVLSLFDWCSCARVALQNLWIKISDYFASEVDKYAIEVSKKNRSWRNFYHIWSVKDITFGELGAFRKGGEENGTKLSSWCFAYKDDDLRIDLLIWWPPCQDLSIAGKRKWLTGERSSLFREYVRILRKVKPKYFIMENVASMSKEARDIITKELWVEPIMINSALVTAQNRKRLYRTNIPGVTQPEDRGILLKDIILDGDAIDLKSYCLTANYQKLTSTDYTKWTGQVIRIWHIGKGWQAERIYSVEWKSVAIKALSWWGWWKTWLYKTSVHKVGNVHPSWRGMNGNVYADTGKSPTITTNKWEWPKIVQCSRWFNQWWDRHEKSPTVGSSHRQQNNKLHVGDIIRKLTPVECERLQGLPDGYTEGVSNHQRYRMIGNWFTVSVIEHILSFIADEYR